MKVYVVYHIDPGIGSLFNDKDEIRIDEVFFDEEKAKSFVRSCGSEYNYQESEIKDE